MGAEHQAVEPHNIPGGGGGASRRQGRECLMLCSKGSLLSLRTEDLLHASLVCHPHCVSYGVFRCHSLVVSNNRFLVFVVVFKGFLSFMVNINSLVFNFISL